MKIDPSTLDAAIQQTAVMVNRAKPDLEAHRAAWQRQLAWVAGDEVCEVLIEDFLQAIHELLDGDVREVVPGKVIKLAVSFAIARAREAVKIIWASEGGLTLTVERNRYRDRLARATTPELLAEADRKLNADVDSLVTMLSTSGYPDHVVSPVVQRITELRGDALDAPKALAVSTEPPNDGQLAAITQAWWSAKMLDG